MKEIDKIAENLQVRLNQLEERKKDAEEEMEAAQKRFDKIERNCIEEGNDIYITTIEQAIPYVVEKLREKNANEKANDPVSWFKKDSLEKSFLVVTKISKGVIGDPRIPGSISCEHKQNYFLTDEGTLLVGVTGQRDIVREVITIDNFIDRLKNDQPLCKDTCTNLIEYLK